MRRVWRERIPFNRQRYLGIGTQAVKTAKETTEPFSASNLYASKTLIGNAFTEGLQRVRITRMCGH